MRNLEQIRQEKQALRLELPASPEAVIKQVLAKLKALDKEETNLLMQSKVERFNREFDHLREIAKKVLQIGEITEDITCNDGSLHKVKAKKYPSINGFEYLRAEYKDGRITSVRVDGKEFRLYKTKHEYGKPTEYTLITDLNEFLDFNSVPSEPLTLEALLTLQNQLNALNEDIKAKMEAYKAEIDKLNVYSFNYWNVCRQDATHFYTYSVTI